LCKFAPTSVTGYAPIMAPKYIWDLGKLEEQRRLIISEMGLTIASEYDTDGRINADSDPEVEYKKYLECVRLENKQTGINRMVLFCLYDFQGYIAALRKT
jgi:hypothetical protein